MRLDATSLIIYFTTSTVKPVLRGTKKKWFLKIGDLLRGSIHMKFSMIGQEKGDLSMQVTA